MSIPLSFLPLEGGYQAESLDIKDRFSTMTTDGSGVWPRHQIALLTNEDEASWTIQEIGSLTRSARPIATGWHRLRYLRQYEVKNPIDIGEVLDAIPTRLQRSVESRIRYGGVLTDKGTVAVLRAIAPAPAPRSLLGKENLVRYKSIIC